ncbi:hypothetical protein ACWIDS_12585 [Dietzia maris]
MSGGTTLVFVNGDDTARESVVFVRYRFVLPALCLIGVAGGIAYSYVADYKISSVLLGAGAMVFNNLAEVEVSRLKRELRTVSVLLAGLVSRLMGVAIVVAIGFSYSMATMAFAYWSLSAVLAIRCERIPRTRISLKSRVALAYSPFYLSVAALDAFSSRLPFIVTGLAIFSGSLDSLATLFSAQQGVTAVLIAAVFTTMAVRNRSGSPSWMRIVDIVTLLATCFAAVLGVVAAGQITSLLGIGDHAAGMWVAFLSIAVVPFVANRVAQYRDHSAKRNRLVIIRLVMTAVGTSGALMFAIVSGAQASYAVAACWLIGESLGVSVSVWWYFVGRSRARHM